MRCLLLSGFIGVLGFVQNEQLLRGKLPKLQKSSVYTRRNSLKNELDDWLPIEKYIRPKRRRPERRGLGDTLFGITFASMIIIATSFGYIENAVASYAPSSAAVTSQLPARKLGLEELENLNPEKAIQRENALGKRSISDLLNELEIRLVELQREVDELENIVNIPSDISQEPTDSSIMELRNKIAEQKAGFEKKKAEIMKELAEKRKFEAELKKRAQILQKLEEQPSWFNYAAAAAASVVSTLIVHPLDTIKTRLQSRVGLTPDEDAHLSAAISDHIPELNGTPELNGIPETTKVQGEMNTIEEEATIQTFQEINTVASSTIQQENEEEISSMAPTLTKARVNTKESFPDDEEHIKIKIKKKEKELDILSLYAGVSGNVAKEAVPSALYLGVYEAVKAILLKTPTGAALPLGVYLISGGVGELFGSVLRAPAEATKSLVQSGLATNFNNACEIIIASKASRDRVFRAWFGSVIRDVPMGAIQICIFEALKLYILNSRSIDIDVNTLQAEAFIGAIGGFIGSLVTTPMDIATTRIITADDQDTRTVFAVMKDIAQESGPQALFSGCLQRSLYWAPAIGIFLSTYCSIRQFAANDPEIRALIDALNAAITN